VTPDSFSDGGDFFATGKAVSHGRKLSADGAHILDIGGESTRPGAQPVDEGIEAQRVRPVVEALAAEGAVISIDTRHASVMETALAAGALIINDVSALEGDPRSLAIAAASDADVVLMHMRGEPATMNDDPVYDDVVEDVYAYLARRVEVCLQAGIPLDRLAVDPGIGFGKRKQHSYALIENLSRFKGLGCPLLIGVSRKLGQANRPKDRVADSVRWAMIAVENGADILRVHDVKETAAALGEAGRA